MTDMESHLNALVIIGPTAIGKSIIGEIVAERLGGEIVSADSRQIYRGLSVGTAKPVSPRVRYWQVDVIEPTERYNAARFVEGALEAMNDIVSRELVPIVVGGTGLYIRALTAGLFPGEFRDDAIRKELRRRHEAGEDLHIFLQRVDTEASQKIAPENYVRIERALEVYLVSGVPISHWWHMETKPPVGWKFVKVGITMDRKMLYDRIEKRVKQMLSSGWIDEVRILLDSGVPENAPAFSSIGYSKVIAHIKGKIDENKMVSEIVKETKHYAKRQMTWFRRESDVNWIDISWVKSDGTGIDRSDVAPSSPKKSADKVIHAWMEGLSEEA